MHPDDRRTPPKREAGSDPAAKRVVRPVPSSHGRSADISSARGKRAVTSARSGGSVPSSAASTRTRKTTTKLNKCHGPVILICIVMILFILAQILLKTPSLNKQNPYIAVVVVQFLVFILPCAFMSSFVNHKMDSGLSYYNLRLFSPRLLGFIFSALAVMLFGSMVIKYLGYLIFGAVGDSTVVYEHDNLFALIAATVLVPAVTEEILFRGVVFTEYEKRGVGPLGAILGSAVLFAFIHFDMGDFASYLFAGIVLAVVIHVTRSLIAPIIIHLLNNTICLFTDTFLKRVSKESISTFFVFFLLTVIFLVSLFLFIENLEWICSNKADKRSGEETPSTETQNYRLIPHNTGVKTILSSVFLTPAFIIVIILYIVNMIAFK